MKKLWRSNVGHVEVLTIKAPPISASRPAPGSRHAHGPGQGRHYGPRNRTSATQAPLAMRPYARRRPERYETRGSCCSNELKVQVHIVRPGPTLMINLSHPALAYSARSN